MSKLYKLYLRTLFAFSTDFLPRDTLSELVTHSMACIDRGKSPLHLPTRAEFYAELKRLTATDTTAPTAPPKIAPIVLTGLYEHTKKITLMKTLHEIAQDGGFNGSLKECKAIVEGLAAGKPFTFNVKTAERRDFCLDSLCAAGAAVVR